MAIQDDEVFREYFPDEKEKKKKKGRSTDMYMTLNLNEAYATMTIERKQLFKRFMVDLFDKRKILSYFHDKDDPTNPLANMDDVQIEYKPEVAPKTGRLHLHALVAIQHHGFYTFQANELRAEAKRVFGHNVYLSCPISSNEKIKWSNYLQKGSRQ